MTGTTTSWLRTWWCWRRRCRGPRSGSRRVRGPDRGAGRDHRGREPCLWPGCSLSCRRWNSPACSRSPRRCFHRLRKGFYGLRVTLLMTLFMALLREPRGRRRDPAAAGGSGPAARARPGAGGQDVAPPNSPSRRPWQGRPAAGRPRRQHATSPPGGGRVPLPRRSRPRLLRPPGSYPRPHRPDADRRPRHRRDLGSATPTVIR